MIHNRITTILGKTDNKGIPLFVLDIFYSVHEKKYVAIILPHDCSRENVLHQFKSTQKDNDAIFDFINASVAKWFPIVKCENPNECFEKLSERLNKLTVTSYAKLCEGIKLFGAACRVPVDKRIGKLNSRVPITILDLTNT